MAPKTAVKEPRVVNTDPRITRLRAARDAAKKLKAAQEACTKSEDRLAREQSACDDVMAQAESPAERALLAEVMGVDA
jgi:hypothetical protein